MSLHGSRMSSGGGGSSSSMSFSRRSTAPRYSQSAYNISFRPSISSSSYAVQSSSRGLGMGAGLGLGGGSFGGGFGGGLGGGSAMMLGGGGVIMDEKNAMQNLNTRLASYLGKVQMLEQSNKDLEIEIRDFAASRTVDGFDWSIYDKTIKPLQQQIHEAILQNSHIALEIDNAKLAAEDFKNKWESELMLRQSVENDIDGLHQLKGTYVQLQADLAHEIAGLEDEIAYLKKNHDEELKLLRQQKTQDVQVEVDSTPSANLSETLQQLRDQYTQLANQNQQDLDTWYKEQVAIKVTQTTQSSQVVDGAKAELSQLRHQMQSLDAEYNSLNGNLAALQNTLNNTEGRYASELQRIMGTVSQLEGELGGIRNNLMSQSQQYEQLLNIKMQLDAELHQYSLLLNGGSQSLISGGSSSSGFLSSMSGKSSGGTTTVVTTTTTEKRGIMN